MTDLTIVPIAAEEAKRAIVTYSRQADAVIARLYDRFQQFRQQYWSETGLPDAVIAIAPEMNNKKLAHYTDTARNGYQIPHAIEFNHNFISLNLGDTAIIEQPDRTIIDHVLLHEMIHLYQDAVLSEKHSNDQAAHGRSFRREARRIGLEGRGRLMACPYPVKMPETKVRKPKNKADDQDDQDNQPKINPQDATDHGGFVMIEATELKKLRELADQPSVPPQILETDELLRQLQQRAVTTLDQEQLKLFEKHFQATTAVLEGRAAPRRPTKRLTYEEKLEKAIKKSFSGSTEKRLYYDEPVTTQEIEGRLSFYQAKITRDPTPDEDDRMIKNWLEIKLNERRQSRG